MMDPKLHYTDRVNLFANLYITLSSFIQISYWEIRKKIKILNFRNMKMHYILHKKPFQLFVYTNEIHHLKYIWIFTRNVKRAIFDHIAANSDYS